MNNKFKYDVAVIGIGRVGLPLALSFADKKLKVIGIDIDDSTIKSVNEKVFPFKEKGYDELIKEVELIASNDISNVQYAENIIITVGTPLYEHIETDLSSIKRVVKSFIPYLVKDHNIILRSTIAPRTTEFVQNYISQRIKLVFEEDIFLSFCPERIVEGQAMEELKTLPQIIGSSSDKSAFKSETLFKNLTKEILHTDFVSAELVKLFNNTYRYVMFSVANQFAIISDNYNADVNKIINMANYNYPRGGIPQPGFTAGTCLRKDFGMINENTPYSDLLLSAWKINEYIPKFLVDGIKKRTTILSKNITILGYTFKKDVDDIRDSLVPKLARYLFRENPRCLLINDPHLGDTLGEDHKNVDLKKSLSNADIVYIAINHKIYSKNIKEILSTCKKGTYIVDLWDVSGNEKIFFKT